MSTQTQFVPLGYAQEAIAPFATLTITDQPDWDAILKEADALYDRLTEEDDERRLADMRFPS